MQRAGRAGGEAPVRVDGRRAANRERATHATRIGAAAGRYAARPMADAAQTPEETGPIPCSPCRGLGTLNSNAGGEPHQVPCPWCEGTGVFIPGHDAQAARRPEGAEPSVPQAGVE
jgi:hypothetical protein